MQFAVEEFIKNMSVERFIRKTPYSALRMNYHTEQNVIEYLIDKNFNLQNAGFQTGLCGIENHDKELREHILYVK